MAVKVHGSSEVPGEDESGLNDVARTIAGRLDASRQGVLAGVARRVFEDGPWLELVDATVPALARTLDAIGAAVLARTPRRAAAVVSGDGALAVGDAGALPNAPARLTPAQLPDAWRRAGGRHALVAPIGVEPLPAMWLAALGSAPEPPGPGELEFVEAVAHLLAAADERRRSEDATRRAATVDALTGLPNRTLFVDRVAHAAERAAREGRALAVVCMDVDRFGDVNDTFGHAAGDELVRGLAQRLRAGLRTTDTIARIGGDEFGVLCELAGDERSSAAVVQRVVAALEQPIVVAEHTLHVSASLGVALGTEITDPGPTVAQRLLREADTAMRRAKDRDGTAFELFDRSMRRRVVQRLRLEQDLRQALDQRQFVLHYQPLVSLRERRIVGVEALVRWQHPKRGLIGPAEFIRAAEETGLIDGLGRWVLGEACDQLARWRADPALAELYVSVNLSARQLATPRIVEDVASILRSTDLPAGRLKLELTETALMDELTSAAETLERLRALGVPLLVDDFGTGYSSLTYLKRLPVDGLKIDRAFVAGIPEDEVDRAMLRAILTMTAALDIPVIAEGIERTEQAAWLAGMDCDVAQGYGLARPSPPAEIERLLRAGTPDFTWSDRLSGPHAAEPESTVALSEAAEALGVSASTLRRWADAGRIGATRTAGGHRRFPASEVRRLSRASGARPQGELRPVQLPERPLVATADVLDRRAASILAAATSIYQPGRSGWFASDASAPALTAWIGALAGACRTGEYQGAIEATRQLLVQSDYAGTSLLERCLFLERIQDAVLRSLREQRVTADDLVDSRRLGRRLGRLAIVEHDD